MVSKLETHREHLKGVRPCKKVRVNKSQLSKLRMASAFFWARKVFGYKAYTKTLFIKDACKKASVLNFSFEFGLNCSGASERPFGGKKMSQAVFLKNSRREKSKMGANMLQSLAVSHW